MYDLEHLSQNLKDWMTQTEVDGCQISPEMSDLGEDIQHLSNLLGEVILRYKEGGGIPPTILDLLTQCLYPKQYTELQEPKSYFEQLEETSHGVSQMSLPEICVIGDPDDPKPLYRMEQYHDSSTYIPNPISLNPGVIVIDIPKTISETLFDENNQLRVGCATVLAEVKQVYALKHVQYLELTEFRQNYPLTPTINYRISIDARSRNGACTVYLVKSEQGTWHFIHGVQPHHLFPSEYKK